MTYIIKGETGDWELVIGLEVHAQVISNAKLFSGAATVFGAEANTQVSFIDAGFPGMLPTINSVCVEQAVRTGLGLKAKINKRSVFARKNYFYADLPQGYQISQFDLPIIGEGEIILDLPDGTSRTVGIERLHLEQDAGKSVHDQHPSKSFIDLNRSGVALMEIVSKPDMRTPEEAGAYLRKLRAILRYLETCDGNMDEGSMRCDVNVSVRKAGEPYRTRCEIKNVNSVRFVMQAIEIEAKRHVEVYESGGDIVQETRLFDPSRGETRSMRSKEHAHDYRYFPDPDLLPLEFDDAFVEAIRATLPELPDEKKARFVETYGMTGYDAGVLVMEKETAAYFEEAAKGRDGKQVANWLITTLFGGLNKKGLSITESPISPAQLGQLVDLVNDNTISGRLAKDVFEIMLEEGKDPAVIVEERGMKQVTDTGAIEAACDAVIAANPEKAQDVRDGKEKLIAWFIGQVMKATQGKANPGMLQEILKKKLLG
ncbi:Asp-tRNA(Asn)/Glu-tRNA(Gln) amidotransferase subunit GatB [Novispirillum itersonii]|uniref:Aspartyl/glutamyl-tRNA(Asn/Gln) amidotransferase subunit B n=1 Tax=Novispirillum itersonii TaxID=189 RepID=A0A7W9ZHX8_NOVIT|nr:Asp-tRNA(Asn)/Glu-tRNA(Gln) amidotransferase subunit GatB [Novispirillum itersonii]MBB6211780.1 aspartyl-tRNA(Asn)/glutamyl-tRNA(Gln) amidotransferase subunit B [Novispirillum itersonii]